MTEQKKAPEVKEKTESTLARLGRLTVGGCAVKDKGESRRKMILFECVWSIYYEPVPGLTPSQSARRNQG